jgi:hypothetical protein
LLDHNSFLSLLSSIEFSEISFEIFEHFKKTFSSTFLNFQEEFSQKFLSFSSIFQNFSSIQHQYIQVSSFFSIPFDHSLFKNILQIQETNGNALSILGYEMSIIDFYQSNHYILFNITFDLWEDDFDYESNNLLCVNIPNSITSLGNECFYKCSSLTQISLPNSITSLGDRCFYECSSLTQISLPNSLQSIGNYCFENCINLIKINPPISLRKIGSYVLKGCFKLVNKPF